MAFVQNQQLQGGRYTIEGQLKDGRFATTYLAKDKEGKPLVIKTPSEQALREGNAKKAAKLQDKFWREAAKLATCQHPHIVRAKEPFKEQTGLPFRRTERVCIPMEFIDGKDLENRPAMSATVDLIPNPVIIDYLQIYKFRFEQKFHRASNPFFPHSK